ncbi:MAG: hypothetical protein ACFFCD_02090 [Promethearchaeota archaeon]
MSNDKESRESNQKKTNDASSPSFTGLKMASFTNEDLNVLYDLFSVLASDKRLDILKATISDSNTRLKDIANEFGLKSSSQVALHAKKLLDAGLLIKKGESLKDSREYLPAILEETYIFLRLALMYVKLLKSRKAELELEKLKEVTETAHEKLSTSSIRTTTAKLSRIPAQYEASLNLARENSQKMAKKFAEIVNVTEI